MNENYLLRISKRDMHYILINRRIAKNTRKNGEKIWGCKNKVRFELMV